MIPRTKVNYGLSELVSALLVREYGDAHRNLLRALLRQYLGAEHLLLTPSGRGGLYALLKATDRPRVFVPAYTCKAVDEAALLAGKELVHVDVQPDGFNMSITELAKRLDGDSVVIATHQFGFPCEIEQIVDLCRDRGALVIEDVAAALGTRRNAHLAGTFGDAAFFSFDSTKLVTVPMKAGFLTVRDPDYFGRVENVYRREIERMPAAHKMKLLMLAAGLLLIENPFVYQIFHWLVFRARGKFTTEAPTLDVRRSEFYRYDFTEWQASIALPQIRNLEEIIRARRSMYSRYHDLLRDCDAFRLPPRDTASEWACVRFPICVAGDKFAYYRAAAAKGVDFAFSFTFLGSSRIHRHAWQIADSVLDLPYYLKLTESEMNEVASVLGSLESELRQ